MRHFDVQYDPGVYRFTTFEGRYSLPAKGGPLYCIYPFMIHDWSVLLISELNRLKGQYLGPPPPPNQGRSGTHIQAASPTVLVCLQWSLCGIYGGNTFP